MEYARVWVLGVGPLMCPKLCLVDIPRMNVYVDGILYPKHIHLFLERLYLAYSDNYALYMNHLHQGVGNAVFTRLFSMFQAHVVCDRYWFDVAEGRVRMSLYFRVYDEQLRWVQNVFATNTINVYTGESNIFVNL